MPSQEEYRIDQKVKTRQKPLYWSLINKEDIAKRTTEQAYNRHMNTHKRHRFLSDTIRFTVWLYYRFNLSHRDIKDLLTERGIIVNREPIRLWRAVEQGGEVGDVYLQAKRDRAAAKRFFRRLLRSHRGGPSKIVSDKLRRYFVAQWELIPETIHSTQLYENTWAK